MTTQHIPVENTEVDSSTGKFQIVKCDDNEIDSNDFDIDETEYMSGETNCFNYMEKIESCQEISENNPVKKANEKLSEGIVEIAKEAELLDSIRKNGEIYTV